MQHRCSPKRSLRWLLVSPMYLLAAFLTAKKKGSLARGCRKYRTNLLMTAADSEAGLKEKYFICWLIIYKPQPNLHSGKTSIQGTLTLVPRMSPEMRVHCKTFYSDLHAVIWSRLTLLNRSPINKQGVFLVYLLSLKNTSNKRENKVLASLQQDDKNWCRKKISAQILNIKGKDKCEFQDKQLVFFSVFFWGGSYHHYASNLLDYKSCLCYLSSLDDCQKSPQLLM